MANVKLEQSTATTIEIPAATKLQLRVSKMKKTYHILFLVTWYQN